jgi:hypothetical protein
VLHDSIALVQALLRETGQAGAILCECMCLVDNSAYGDPGHGNLTLNDE